MVVMDGSFQHSDQVGMYCDSLPFGTTKSANTLATRLHGRSRTLQCRYDPRKRRFLDDRWCTESEESTQREPTALAIPEAQEGDGEAGEGASHVSEWGGAGAGRNARLLVKGRVEKTAGHKVQTPCRTTRKGLIGVVAGMDGCLDNAAA